MPNITILFGFFWKILPESVDRVLLIELYSVWPPDEGPWIAAKN